MKNKILVLGKGFLGLKVKKIFNCNIAPDRISTFNDAKEIVEKYRPKILINCIGYTGRSNVDDCEINKNKTLLANTFVPIILAEIVVRYKIKLIHISSGCIYHYDYKKGRPISEKKNPDFFDLFYSRSKIFAERALEVLCDEYKVLILRIRVPLDDQPHPKNLLTKLISYKKIIDIPNSITYIPDFLKAMKHLISIDAHGIYNVANKGVLRYPELLEQYKKVVPNFKYKTIKFNSLNVIRTNVILSVRKLEKTGFKMRNIKDVLNECVKNYINYK